MKGIKNIIKKACAEVLKLGQRFEDERLRRQFRLPESVSIYRCSLEGNIAIGEFTYVNEGSRIDTGSKASVVIGKHCAIGRYVHITAKTHSLYQPTTDAHHETILHTEEDVRIGDAVWIGDKAIILPGVTIGNYAIIGANAVVNCNVQDFEIVGGIPAKHIRFNTVHHKFQMKDSFIYDQKPEISVQ